MYKVATASLDNFVFKIFHDLNFHGKLILYSVLREINLQ